MLVEQIVFKNNVLLKPTESSFPLFFFVVKIFHPQDVQENGTRIFLVQHEAKQSFCCALLSEKKVCKRVDRDPDSAIFIDSHS